MRSDIKSNIQLFNSCLTKDHLNYNRCCRLMDSSTKEVGLRLPVFLRILPDMICDEWPSNLLTRLKYTLCQNWSKKKRKWNFNCRSCTVIRPTLPLELAWQQDWWQISVVMFRRKDSFPSNSFQFSMSALILSMYYDFGLTWDWGSLFQSSTNPLVSNSPPLPPPPSNP